MLWGFDLLDNFINKVVIPIILFGVIIIAASSYVAYRIGKKSGIESIMQAPLNEQRKADRVYGYHIGILAMANNDRKIHNLPEYKNWDDLTADWDKQAKEASDFREWWAEESKRMDEEEAKKKAEEDKEKTLKPWMKK
jgi:hypothetical protein